MFRKTVLAMTLATLASPVLAHATLEVQQAPVGSTYKAVLRVPHGCGDQATHTVRVQIPEGFYNVKPMPKPGWTLEVVKGAYEKPFENHGATLTEGVKEIVWSGGNLPNEFYDEFVFRGSFGKDLEPGSTFWFPAVQECANGEEAWIDTTGNPDADMPAPRLKLIEGAAH
ncbi:DUF1775 domain-containing protein [Paracoccus sp. S3-43]|uniref:YcnI family copper-binding membrane protein n=1 Tax=Paracoccus sp. S3-43 TaxID=3030011 RepID=UPI0023B03B22|nr:DUF1775 domain-containing protein [Paracoccus sp. S3-43]WEF24848.1 DUF1775 domain-containing protein [Paracoccus sp. S3-43]